MNIMDTMVTMFIMDIMVITTITIIPTEKKITILNKKNTMDHTNKNHLGHNS